MSGPNRLERQKFYGLYPALVSEIVDPDNRARIKVSFPWLGGEGDDVFAWARLISPYAADDQGFEFVPSVGSEVVVAFEAGDPGRPFIVGACWNGKERMPEKPAAPNNKRLIKTRSGNLLEFDDTDGASKVTLSMKSGHKLVMDDATSEIEITHANGCTIRFNAGGQIEVTANSTVEVTAPAVNVHAATATFDGMVNCTTLTASVGVVSPSYTPGAGNIW